MAAVALLCSGATLHGCAGSGKLVHDRHSMSRLYVDEQGDGLVFEASVSPEYPRDSDGGEAVRREWMQQWLTQRKLCDNGFTVLERQDIGSAADNPYWHDLRYRLRCN